MTGPDDQQYRDQPQDDRPTAESSETEHTFDAGTAGGASPAGASPAGGATPAAFGTDEPTAVVPQEHLGVSGTTGNADKAAAGTGSDTGTAGLPPTAAYPAAAADSPADGSDADGSESPADGSGSYGAESPAYGSDASAGATPASSEQFPANPAAADDSDRTQMLPEAAGPGGYRSTPAYSDAPGFDDQLQSPHGDSYGAAGAGAAATYQQPQAPYPPQQPGGYQQQTGGYQAQTGGQGFFAQQAPHVQLDPPKNRIAQNLGGALIGLVLTLGAAALCGLLAYKLDILADPTTGSPADPSTLQRLAFYGLIAVAALPALLAGFAPATAWVPGVVIFAAALIATFSTSFATRMGEVSNDLFGTPGAATFVGQVGIPLGLALLFAGLGAVWARKAGEASVIARISGARP